MTAIGIIGGTGYTGGELARILCRHPDVEIRAMTSRRDAGRRVDDVHTFLRGYVDPGLEYTETVDGMDLDLVFVATPHGVAMGIAPDLLDRGVRVIDMSGDYRLRDPSVYAAWYGHEHTDVDHLADAVYGLPELFRDGIRGARLVANPGCYATSAILAISPLMRSGLVDGDVIVDSKSGTSGAGMVPTPLTHHPNCASAVLPYGVGTHRHTPEIEAAVGAHSGRDVTVTFVPHLVPVVRGILSDCYMSLADGVTQEDVDAVYEGAYGGERFVRYVPSPDSADVAGSNNAEVACTVVGGRAVAFGAIDNLVKGASGQAVQCMNLMLGFDEAAGLDFPGLGV